MNYRNVMEGNEDNQRQVAELQIVGGAESKELRELGLQVVVDEQTKKVTLQNVPADRIETKD
jgi:ataxin-10